MTRQPYTLTVPILREWFAHFNRDYFAAELPAPTIKLSRSRTRLGTMSWHCSRQFGKECRYGYTIRISTFFEQSEREFMEVFLHEMIHYYIAYKGVRDTSSHGRTFVEMMSDINAKGGWNITVSAHTGDKRISAASARNKERLILALEMANGKCYFAVVNPSYATSIKRVMTRTKDVERFRWYVSDDTFFATFPQVRTPRACHVERSVFLEKTASMKPFDI